MSVAELFKKAVSFHQRGRLNNAEKYYRKAISEDAEHISSLYNLAVVLQSKGNSGEAEKYYNNVIEIKPDYANAYNSLGLLLQKKGQLGDALKNLESAVALKPSSVFHTNLAELLIVLRNKDKAKLHLDKAIALDSNNAAAHLKLATIFHDREELGQAEKHYRQAISINQDLFLAQKNLGILLAQKGEIKEAETIDKNIQDNKDYNVSIVAEILKYKQKYCDWDRFDELKEKVVRIADKISSKGRLPGVEPFDHMTICNDPVKNLAVTKVRSKKIKEQVEGFQQNFSFSDRKTKKDQIRVGYISADFKSHPFAHVSQYLYGAHNREKFLIFGYATTADDGSDCRKVIQNGCDKFTDLTKIDDVGASRIIYEDKIDILVELTGHTSGARMEISAMKPSPIQVNYDGYPSTVGADWVDYIIADELVIPVEHDKYYTENIVYISDTLQINHRNEKISDKDFRKSDFDLLENSFVFSAHCPTYKLEPIIFDVWMRLLKKIPKSVLWLREPEELAKKNIFKEAQKRGIDPNRIFFAGKINNRGEYFKRLQLADLCLDTRVYNGGTTTMDALWAGVPVITLLGSNYSSRMSSGLVNGAEMPELITKNLQEYEKLALELAENPKKLSKLRLKLWEKREICPLFDTEGFVRKLEKAYEQMWITFISGEKPHKIRL